MIVSDAKEEMLVVSTVHVKPETFSWICEDYNQKDGLLISYLKGLEGFFIFVDEDYLVSTENIPEDLFSIFKLAVQQHCYWICLDSEGFEIDSLPKYKTEWEEFENTLESVAKY